MPKGLLVALWLDPDTAGSLAVPGGEPADALHVTLAYCGDAAALGDLAVARAVAAVDAEVRWREPLRGAVGGYGRFAASDTSDGKDVFYAAVDVPWLVELRQAVAAALSGAGCPPSARHGFTPHVTLAYLDPDAPNPVERVPAVDLAFRAVTVVADDRRIDVPMHEGVVAFAVRPDDAHPGHLAVVQPFAARFAEPPEWAPFLPVPGAYTHPVYGHLDFSPERYARIVEGFAAGVYQDRLPVNAEHDAMSSGAVGWITDMRLADDGSVEARVEWNERGRSLIADDRYRYVSAEWFDVWTDPVTGEAVPDVAVGLALTTHPYFKESVLRPLAASEAALTRVEAAGADPAQAGESGEEHGMGDKEPTPTTTAPPDPPADDDRRAADPVVRQLTEEAAREFAELRRAKKQLEDENARLATERATLLAQSRVKRFTDEVRGASESNDKPYVGPILDHVRMLCDLEEAFGAGCWHVQHYQAMNRAHAEQIEQSSLFREMGVGRAPDATGTAEEEVAAQAREVARTTGKTFAQAYQTVLDTNRELRAKVARERRGGR